MRTAFFILGLTAALGCIAGCSRDDAGPPAVAKPVVATAASESGDQDEKDAPTGSNDTGGMQPNSQASSAESEREEHAGGDQQSDVASDEKAENEEIAERPAPERVAILTPGGPLLADVRVFVDGAAHGDAHQKLMDGVLAAGDIDRDGSPTWKELTENREYFEKQMQNAPAADSRQLKALIERYDENRDGKIQPGEAASWLGRDAGRSAKPFALRSTRAYRPTPRALSQIWHLIDRDDDGRLTSAEIDSASGRLLSLDADDDRVLMPAEMASLREQLEAAAQQRPYIGRDANHYAAMHLEANVEFERLHYLLSDLYAPRQDLTAASFPAIPGLFKKLDASGDEWLDSDELAALRTVEPHIEIEINFAQPTPDNPGSATMEIQVRSPEVQLAQRPSPDRAIIVVGKTRLIFSTHSLAARPEGAMNSAQQAARSEVRLMVHDQADALFEELDANADGRLGEKEIESCTKRLAEKDANGDGELSGEEFPYSMIVAFMLGEQPAQNSFYIPPSSAVMAASNKPAPAWFEHADLNGDGDVSRREFLGTAEQFGRLDADKDGFVTVDEATM